MRNININRWRSNAAFRGFALAGASAAVLSAGACATAISPQQEAQIGAQSAAEINQKLPIVNDGSLNNYINALGNELARRGQRGIGYRFFIVNSNAVNAFAVPGGYIYVNRGLIERSANTAELAGVLAHEIEHVELRHSVQQMEQMQKANIGLTLASILLSRSSQTVQQGAGTAANVLGTAYFAKFSREDENEADAAAVPLMVAAGYDPNGLTTMFQKLLEESRRSPTAVEQWFSTHPTTQERVANAQRLVSQIPAAQRSRLTRDTNAFQSFKSRMRSYSPRASD
jgi:beta-barrel assembly-enhancing protease